MSRVEVSWEKTEWNQGVIERWGGGGGYRWERSRAEIFIYCFPQDEMAWTETASGSPYSSCVSISPWMMRKLRS